MPRKLDPNAVECSGCGAHVDFAGSWPCQGDIEESCEARLCDPCVGKCYGCTLPCCSEHLTDLSGDKWCGICAGAMVEEAARELAEEMECIV